MRNTKTPVQDPKSLVGATLAVARVPGRGRNKGGFGTRPYDVWIGASHIVGAGPRPARRCRPGAAHEVAAAEGPDTLRTRHPRGTLE